MYKHHRFFPDIIQYAVWVYYRFNLSIRDVEDLLAQREIIVSYEAIRQWVNKFGYFFLENLRKHTEAMATLYILMKYTLKKMESSTTYGQRWIKTVMWLMFYCKLNVMEKQQSVSLNAC